MAFLNLFTHLLVLILSTRMTFAVGPKSVLTDTSSPPYLAMASMPSPGLDGHSLVNVLVDTLLGFGGYTEITDLLVNMTSMADKIERLAMEEAGPAHGLTLLAPNDEALMSLGAEQLEDPNLPERLLHYHLIAGYFTEESMYFHSRRLGKVQYDTLLLPFTVRAEEAEGTVKVVGGGGNWAHLIDPDIYVDGCRVSIQGIDDVLFPPVVANALS